MHEHRERDNYVHMDEWTNSLRRVVTVANRKGGVLKSSVCRNVAAVATAAGYRVAVVDGDPQGNLSEIDFGLATDRGRSLAMAMQYGTPLQPVVHELGVDVICGGAELQGALGAASTPGAEVSLEDNLRASLGALCTEKGYDLVLIDTGPGDTRLLDAYLRASRWLVVPTISDEASFAGVDKMGARYAAAKQAGAEIEFLGAVLTKVNHQATARNAAIRSELGDALGDAGEPFQAMIRYNDANSIDARRHGMSAQDVAVEAITQRKSRLADLRRRARGEKQRGDQDAWWSTSKNAGAALASDYEALTREILTRIGAKELSHG
ncbi:MAG: AAA family ATPase [Intrasporangium sp.]|uniref:ParA family protein n=1 Tax=Intrasporangium sp. TaxID=1925024 RepID=UPI002649FEA9|nr:AAA family ATPase [Intrasporangium sp.]MDN5797266.1 AAA family ATPase [Intrasporangium sp.]